ncbi:Alpha/Beta hydrolase protein [Phaeosphaeriaceae sp. PMI808]|nr:Alpha/Beta hydrolase protein [Phaeosphaeriaceae sp. PMI808]
MNGSTHDAHKEGEAITPYSMHVSSRYLELTKKKLELTRLPRELELPEPKKWEHGTPKTVLEPLLDFWLEGYDWRVEEAGFNATLPQFRTNITVPSATDASASQPLRIHFVHKKSRHANAIPLLLCHSWPSSFIEVQRIIDSLTDPYSLPSIGQGAQQAFHVIAPSIPGFGFSDASSSLGFGLKETAAVFNQLMLKLGYNRYVAHGIEWGFSICRTLALWHPQHCLAVHTANPTFTEPTPKRGAMAFIKYRIAKLTLGKLPLLSFGYVPTELESFQDTKHSTSQDSTYANQPLGLTLHRLYSLRPQTLSYSLCDSPIGLLAALLDIIHTRVPLGPPLTSRSRSPFLSAVELGRLDEENAHIRNTHERGASDDTVRAFPLRPQQSELNTRGYTWTPTEILNWTMMQWLPGPESSLRWLRQAHLDTTAPRWNDYCAVPLGISSFHDRNSSQKTPLMWGASSWNVEWVKRHLRAASLPAWEAPDLLVVDLRECFGALMAHGKLTNLPLAAS